jgi:Protein of unknown function (DUF3987)
MSMHPLDKRKAERDALVTRFDSLPSMKEQRSLAVLSTALREQGARLMQEPVSTEPEPLRRPLPPAEAYPLDALGNLLGEAAKAIAQTVQAPDALIGQSLLAAASLAVQHLADVEIDGRTEPLSFWCMSIAVSGERKSIVDSLALRAHREYEREQLDRYKREKVDHDITLQAYEAASRAATKGKDQDEIESRLHALKSPPDAPLKPLLLMGSPTLEGLHKQFVAGLPSLGLFHDDAGEFLGGHSMSAEHKTKTVAGLSRLWDCGEFDRVRAGDGAEKHYGKRLAMHLMMQPVIAETILSDDVLTGQGFLARCLLTWPASTIGLRQYVPRDLTKDPAMNCYWRLMRDLLAFKPVLREGSRNELAPRTLTLTTEAKERWRAVYSVIELDQIDGGDYSPVRPWASKAASQVLRIAGVLALVDDPNTGVIQAAVIDRAAQLMNHYLAEAVRIVGTNSVPVTIRHAEALLEWCHSAHIQHLHSVAALQLGPGCIRSRPAFDAAIAELDKSGWVSSIPGGAVVDGKPRKRVWTVRAKT